MSHSREYSASAMASRTAMILLVFVLVFTGLLAGVYKLTRPSIEAAEATTKMALINELLAAGEYDNDLLADPISLPASLELGTSVASPAYRAMKDGKIVAVIFEAVAPDGYAGPIRLLVSVRSNGALSGVRVVGHKETPGLGDYIEVRKDRRRDKPWITQFSGRSLLDPVESAWKVKKDGGDFDANAGATVTPRAVVRAVHRALAHVNRQADTLFEVGVKP